MHIFWIVYFVMIGYAHANSAQAVELNNVQTVVRSPKPPSWVLGQEHKNFISSRYLVGVGFSSMNPVMASESARAELSKNISFKIKSVMKDYMSTEGSLAESFIKTETDTLLEGVQIKDGWYDPEKNTFYSFAVVKREDVLNTVRDQIEEIEHNISLTMSQADSFYEKELFLKALVYYYNGFNESNKLLPLVRTYKSVSLLPEVPPLSTNTPEPSTFKRKLQNIVEHIQINKIDNLNEIVRTNNDVSFTVKLTVFDKAIKDLPIIFQGNDYNLFAKVKSDEHGICRIKTKSSSIIKLHQEFAYVKAKIDMFTLAKQFNYRLTKNLFGRLENLNVSFKKPVQSNVKVWLNRTEYNIGDKMIINVETDEPGYLVLYSTVHGTLTKIFPNSKMKDNYIHANRLYSIGGSGYDFYYEARPPYGKGTVKVLIYNNKEQDLERSRSYFNYEVLKGD